MIVEYDCEWCGKHVRKKRSPANMKGNAGRFCSQKCNGAARKGTGDGHRPNFRATCETCGTEFSTYRSPSNRAPRFCSQKCASIGNEGTANPAFSGGRHIADTGYVRVLRTTHPDADCRGYIYEHRAIMEEKIGRRLRSEEVVHHINHIRDDNRPENLMLFANHSDHIKYHHQEDEK